MSRTCAVELVDVRAVASRDERVDDIEREVTSVVYGEVQRRPALVVAVVHVRAVIEQLSYAAQHVVSDALV